MALQARKDVLAATDFKSSVLAEQPERIDVRRRVRMSMTALGGVHLKLRAHLAPYVEAARASFDAAISDYLAAGATSVVGLAACRDGNEKADVPVLVEWDDDRLRLVNKNSQPPSLLARPKHDEPTTADISALRMATGDTVAQAAKQVFVNEARWAEWEAGLPMPKGLFILYQLQVGKHPSHEVKCLAPPSAKSPAADLPKQG